MSARIVAAGDRHTASVDFRNIGAIHVYHDADDRKGVGACLDITIHRQDGQLVVSLEPHPRTANVAIVTPKTTEVHEPRAR